jgi:hypothetical protein
VEALVILVPEHVRTIHRDGFSKQDVRRFLFENTGIPVREYTGDGGPPPAGSGKGMRPAQGSGPQGGEGTQNVDQYSKVQIDGELCYQKFAAPEAIHIIVTGGTAGRFSAVVGSWIAGPRGSQMVTYPI